MFRENTLCIWSFFWTWKKHSLQTFTTITKLWEIKLRISNRAINAQRYCFCFWNEFSHLQTNSIFSHIMIMEKKHYFLQVVEHHQKALSNVSKETSPRQNNLGQNNPNSSIKFIIKKLLNLIKIQINAKTNFLVWHSGSTA